MKADHYVGAFYTCGKCTTWTGLGVDVSFKDRYDTLTETTIMVTVRLDLNPEVIMDTGSYYRILCLIH